MAIDAKVVMDLCKKTGAKLMDCKRALQETNGNEEEALVILKKKGLAVAEKRAGREAKEGRVAAYVNDKHEAGALVELNCETSFVAKTDEFIKLTEDLAKYVASNPNLADVAALNENAHCKEMITEIQGKLGEKMEVGKVAYEKADANGRIDSYIHSGSTLGALVSTKYGSDEAKNADKAAELGHEIGMQIAAASPSYLKREEIPEDIISRETEIYMARAKEEGKPEGAWANITKGRMEKFFENNCLIDQLYIRDPKKKVSGVVKEFGAELKTTIEIVKYVRFKVGELA